MTIIVPSFPGVPESQSGNAGAAQATLTVALPTPPAGSRQYLTKVLITCDNAAAFSGANVALINVDAGSGTGPSYDVAAMTTTQGYYPLDFNQAWPCFATAVAATATINAIGTNFGATIRCTLWGYNVPE